MEEIKHDYTLDATGLSCPLPVLRFAKAIKKLNAGQILELLSTDSGTKKDLPEFCKNKGHELLAIKEEGGLWRFYVRKGG
jgi:tRNA 2-thiouridine synthesizing protein A